MNSTPLFDPPLPLFDTHCHLDFEVFDAERSQILANCRRQGVERVLVPGVEARGWQRLLTLCEQHQELYPALGLHPCFIDQHQADDLQRLGELLKRPEVVAVGEFGLDFWLGRDNEEKQVQLFEAQLRLAVEHRLPVVLHARKAHDTILKRLRRTRGLVGGVVHAFSGSRQQAEQYQALGLKIGVGGALTYPRARKLRSIVAELPLQSLVLETDAPDMPLCGRQGQINRPDYLPATFAVLAQLRSESAELLAQQLWRNSLDLFGG